METVSILSPNEVISCLWNKNAREKCRIGLADAVLYENLLPTKWYFTGKTGEVLKKKGVVTVSISERWKKIAASTDSSIIAILRQENGLLKFFREPAWESWCDENLGNVDSSVISLHCFIRGSSNLVYRNSFELKDKLGRFITSTKTYKLQLGEEELSPVTMMTQKDYVFNDLKAANIRSVMDLATSTIIKYIEVMLQVRVASISIDYIVDTKSQLWVLWTSEAKIFHKNLVDTRSRHGSPGGLTLRDSLEDDFSAPNQVDLTLNALNDNRLLSEQSSTSLSRGKPRVDSSAGFKVVRTTEGKRADNTKCKGDFCSVYLQSVGSLASQADVKQSAMESFFSEEERMLLKKYDKYHAMTDFSDESLQYDFIPMKSVLQARAERRGMARPQDSLQDQSWKDYPDSPREGGVFPSRRQQVKEQSLAELEEESAQAAQEKEKLATLAKDKLRRETFNNEVLSYYDSVKVCPTCYKVYLLLDWARQTLALEAKNPSKKSRKAVTLQITNAEATPTVRTTASDASLLRPKKGKDTGGAVSRRQNTWKNYASKSGAKQHQSDFIDLDNYLRGGIKSSKQAPVGSDDEEDDKELPDNLYRGNVLVAFDTLEKAEVAAEALRASHFNVLFCIDGRQVVNEVLSKADLHKSYISTQNIDCILIQRDLKLADAFDVTRHIREFERSSRQKEAADLAAGGIGQPPRNKRIPIICCSADTSPSALQALMKADMDGCLSLPIDQSALVNTVRAAVPHHLAQLNTPPPEHPTQKVFRVGPMGIKEGSHDSSAMAYKSLSTAKSKEEDCAYNGLAQLDADTLLPFIVMDASRGAAVEMKNRQAVFNLVVCHDLFDTAERLKIFLRPIVTKYVGIQVLLWNYPGQAFTEWRSEQLLNNEYHAVCLNELLGQIGHLGTNDFDTSHPFYILGYGHGMSIATFYAAHYNIPNMRGIICINGWSFLDSYMAGVMHDCINIFECAPPSRPDLPVYFFSRFLFSRDYLAKASVPLALNIYTAVHNPITIKGRIGLCKGVLQLVDTRAVLNEIDRAVICIQSTQDALTRPLHAEPFVTYRGGEADSIHHALDEPSKTCVIWMKAGHELFQEKRTDTLTLIEQILSGFHEVHNVHVPGADAVDMQTTVEVKAQVALSNESFGSAVEDRFISNVLKSVEKVKAHQEHDAAVATKMEAHSTTHHLADIIPSKGRAAAAISHAKHPPAENAANDPNVWLEYSNKLSETQVVGRKVEQQHKKTQEFTEPLLVLDPTSINFDRQDSLKRTQPNTLTHKPNATEFPEVKEYMSWRLKRNKRRLQRLQNAARIIQCGYRCHLARVKVQKIRLTKAAKTVQRYFRGWLGRMKFLERAKLLWAVQMVQMYWRGYAARKLHYMMRLEIAAAVTIQKTFRGARARKIVRAKRRKQHRSACLIQSLYRRMRARKDVFRMRLERNMATLIQRVYRGRLGRKKAAAELDKYIFSRSQTQGIEFGRQMLLEHKLHATKLQSDVALLAQEKVAAEELVEQLLEEISSFEEGVRTLEKDMHRLSKVEADAAAFMDDESKYELREQKMRLDKEFGSMLAKISNRKESLADLEKKLAMIDKFRLKKEEELRTLERKLVVLLEEQQNELNAIKKKQDVRGNMLIASHEQLANAVAPSGSSKGSTALVVGSRGGGSGGPSVQEKRQAAQLMQSTETLMKFGFMSMSMTYFSSLNMIKALRTVSAQDTVMAALADVHAQKAVGFGMEGAGGTAGAAGGTGKFVPDLKRGQLPGQEALRVSGWSVEDVSKWLDTLSLGQYKEAFIDAAIDGEFLYDLDEEDLKNTLGIEHRLHRKKILNCVQRLKVAEAQEDTKLDMLLRETNAMDAPTIGGADPMRSFASLESGSVASAAGGDGRNEPKISLPELVTLVRHSKYSKVKEALDYIPTKKFDPSVIEAQYITDHGTVYIDSYDRVPFHINRGSDHNNTLLIIAAQNGNSKLVKYLISKGANPNHQNDTGQTAAHFAVEYKFFEISTWIFENGGVDYLENKFGLTAYDGLSRGDDDAGGDDSSVELVE